MSMISTEVSISQDLRITVEGWEREREREREKGATSDCRTIPEAVIRELNRIASLHSI